MVDEWQRVRIGFHAPHAAHFWIAPIETVSESEDGFERIYQGSQIMAVWPVELTSGAGGDAGVGARTTPTLTLVVNGPAIFRFTSATFRPLPSS